MNKPSEEAMREAREIAEEWLLWKATNVHSTSEATHKLSDMFATALQKRDERIRELEKLAEKGAK